MYIYKSHMGGLYVSDEILDYDMLYCETCGDSDELVGTAETAAEAWDLLKDETDTFDESICEKCSHKEDYEYCNFECEEYQKSGGFSFSYISKFIYENFDIENPVYFILISRPQGYKDMILSKINFNKDKTKDNTYNLLKCPTIDENIKLPVYDLGFASDNFNENTLKFINKEKIKDSTYIIYTCESVEDSEDKTWQESCHCYDDGWYGYIEKDELIKNIDEKDKEILNLLQEKQII